MNPYQFILEQWKAYGSYMERKERVIEVATTLCLTSPQHSSCERTNSGATTEGRCPCLALGQRC